MHKLLQLLPKIYTKVTRIYLGTKHEFDAKKFHDNCDDQGETLTLVKSK